MALFVQKTELELVFSVCVMSTKRRILCHGHKKLENIEV